MKKLIIFILLAIEFNTNAQQLQPVYDSINQKYGFNVTKVIEPQFDNIWECLEGSYIIQSNGKHGYMNSNGDMVIEPVFDFAAEHNGTGYLFFFNSDTMYVWDSHNLFYRDTFILVDGIYSLIFDAGQSYISGYDYFRVRKDGKMAYASVFNGIEVNLKTDFLLEVKFECGKKNRSLYLAGNNKKLSFCELNGKQLFPHVVEDFLCVEKENAIVLMNGKVQFINLCTGKISNSVSGFNEMICTNLEGKNGVINNNGKVIFPFDYDAIRKYRENYYKLFKGETATESTTDLNFHFLGIFDNTNHNYVHSQDLNLDWLNQSCEGLDFIKDIHGVKNPNAEVSEYSMAVFKYNSETKMLEKKSDFIYWMMDCFADKDGTITIWSGPDKVGKIDRDANVVWREK